MTDSEKFKYYLQTGHHSPKSISNRMIILHQYKKWLTQENLETEQVTYSDLLHYVQHSKKRGISQKTIQNYLNTLSHYYDYLMGEKVITGNPVTGIAIKGVKRKVLHSILSPQELQAIYDQYPRRTPKEIRDKVILGLLINQGLKTEELAKLEVNQVHLREGKLEVPGGRKSNGRTLELASRQIMELYEYVLRSRAEIQALPPKRKYQQKNDSDTLIIGDGGQEADLTNYMTRLMVKVRKRDPRVINAKQVRASVITKWLKMYNLREVQYLAGHRYISSTESYQENEMESLQEEVNQYHLLG